MTERLSVAQRFKNACDWFGAGFYTPQACSRSEAEQKLGALFPQSYLDLMAELKDLAAPSEDIIQAHSTIDIQSWPKNLVMFFQDGHGNCYCFDTRFASVEGEHPIVFWDHELNRDENIARTAETDTTFSNWAQRYAREEIADEQSTVLEKAIGIGCFIAILLIVSLAAFGIVAIIKWIN